MTTEATEIVALQKSTQNQLRQYIEQIERLMEDKAGISSDIRDKFSEAKSAGFNTKAMKELIKIRKKSHIEVVEFDSILEVYKHALGMLPEDGGEE